MYSKATKIRKPNRENNNKDESIKATRQVQKVLVDQIVSPTGVLYPKYKDS